VLRNILGAYFNELQGRKGSTNKLRYPQDFDAVVAFFVTFFLIKESKERRPLVSLRKTISLV